MRKWVVICVALVLLAIWDAVLGGRVAGAYAAAERVQLKLDEANGEIEALTKEVKELDDARNLDEQRLAELEARILK